MVLGEGRDVCHEHQDVGSEVFFFFFCGEPNISLVVIKICHLLAQLQFGTRPVLCFTFGRIALSRESRVLLPAASVFYLWVEAQKNVSIDYCREQHFSFRLIFFFVLFVQLPEVCCIIFFKANRLDPEMCCFLFFFLWIVLQPSNGRTEDSRCSVGASHACHLLFHATFSYVKGRGSKYIITWRLCRRGQCR